MKNQQIKHVWTCPCCGLVNEIFNQEGFIDLCLNLLAGRNEKTVCSSCGQTDLVRFKDSTLELVG